jgi:Lon protease-like protein
VLHLHVVTAGGTCHAGVPPCMFHLCAARLRLLQYRIEPELVQQESPFKGSKKFGMCYVSSQGLSAYGTVLEITQHQVLPDGRLLVLTKGLDRFKVHDIKQEKPVLLCEVEMLEDDANEEELAEAAEKAKELFRNVLRLNARYKKIELKDEHLVRTCAYSCLCRW